MPAFRTIVLVLAALAGEAAALTAQPSVDHLTIVAPAAPGGGWDQTARALQHVVDTRGLARLTEVENVAGAAGTIGLAQFVGSQAGRADALLVTGLVMLGATLWNDSPVTIGQATPIARLTGEYEVIAVPAASPLRDMRGLIDAFRRRPEAFAWGGGSAGGTDHILAGLIAEAAGIDPRRVNYVAFSGGGEAVAALLGGHVSAGVSGYSEFAAHLASGRLRALAISAPSRLAGIDVPTIREAGLDVEMANWRGLLAPANVNAEDRGRLTRLVREAVRSEEWRRLLVERGWIDQYLEGEAFASFLAEENTRYLRVVARLRGPASSQPVMVGRQIIPSAVLAGGTGIFAMLILSRWRRRAARERRTATARSAVAGVSFALVTFLVLLDPLGFAVAGTALFVLAAAALMPGATRRQRMWTIVIAILFVTIVDLAFTRGLDLALPRGSWLAWTR